MHTHPTRRGHFPKALTVPENVAHDNPVPRRMMQLFAVLCIHTSHYVSFVKYGLETHSWLFFDSMADRFGKAEFLFLTWAQNIFLCIFVAKELTVFCCSCKLWLVVVKWLCMTTPFDKAASTVFDKATLWRPWLIFISSWADVDNQGHSLLQVMINTATTFLRSKLVQSWAISCPSRRRCSLTLTLLKLLHWCTGYCVIPTCFYTKTQPSHFQNQTIRSLKCTWGWVHNVPITASY